MNAFASHRGERDRAPQARSLTAPAALSERGLSYDFPV